MEKNLIKNEEIKKEFAYKLNISIEKVEKAYDWVNRFYSLKLSDTHPYQVTLLHTDPEGCGEEELVTFSDGQNFWFDSKEKAIKVANEQKDKYILDHWHAGMYGYPENILILLEPLVL